MLGRRVGSSATSAGASASIHAAAIAAAANTRRCKSFVPLRTSSQLLRSTPTHPLECVATAAPASSEAPTSSGRDSAAAPASPQHSGAAAAQRTVVVAIDGGAACGKGTLSKAIAEAFNLAHLDTGLLYRAVGFGAVKRGIALDAVEPLVSLCGSLTSEDLADPGLRGDEAAQAASRVSVIPSVRAALGEYPRRFASNPPSGFCGAVLDGRDVGTVLCPEANVKLFLTASAEVRARRRLQELVQRGMVPQSDTQGQDDMFRKVLQDLEERDRRDSSRATAPLRAADDAHVLDTSSMTAQEVLASAAAIIQDVCPWLTPQPTGTK